MKIRSILGYGCLLKQPLLIGEEETDWMDFVAEKYGMKIPSLPIKKNVEKHKKYWKKRDTLIKELGIRVEPYGYFKTYDCFLVVSDSLNFATDGLATCLFNGDLEVNKEWDKKLISVLEKLEIDKDSPFNWYLMSYWED